jgi:micrococcal nuclease
MGLFDFGLCGRFGRRSNPQVSRPQGQTIKATVVSVTDGDTIKVCVGNELQTVRIIGYDSPELNQNFGDKAFLYLKTLPEGREVILENDVQATDKYGRRLYCV